MLKPIYKISAAGATLDPSAKNSKTDLVKVRVERDLYVPCDSCEIIFKADGASGASKDSAVTVEIGYDGDGTTKVFTGSATAVEPGIENVTVRGKTVALKLLQTRINQEYDQQFAGAIAKELLNAAGVTPGTVENGIKFPRYVVDDNKNAYEHIRELANLCGFEIFVDTEEKFNFGPYSKKGTHNITYGDNVIESRSWSVTEPVSKVEIYGESPSSDKGADTWPQITIKPIKGMDGSGSKVVREDMWALSNKDATKSVAQAMLKKFKIVEFGQATILGNSKIMLGDAVKVEEMPDSSMNGEFQVTRIVHIIEPKKGFITIVEWQKPAA